MRRAVLRQYRSLGALVLTLAAACAASPQSAPPYRLGEPAQSDCARTVQLLTADQLARSYTEVAEVSATCPYLSPTTCDRILLSRGCELEGDAVVLGKTSTLGTPRRGPSASARLVEEARVVRWTSNSAAR